jgi:AraC-like DNA-binding protein
MPAKLNIHRDRNRIGIGGYVPSFPEFAWIGFSKKTDTHSVYRHEHPGLFEVNIFVRGRVTMYARDRMYQFSGGDVFVTWPGEPHGARHDTMEPCTHYCLAFSLPQPRSSKPILGLPREEGRALSKAVHGLNGNHLRGAEKLVPSVKAMLNGLQAGAAGNLLGLTQARAAFASMLIELISLPAASKQRGVIPPGITRAREFLESCPTPWPSIKELAEIAGMSVSHFCACFSQWVGAAPLKFSHHMRLRRAQELLADPRASVTSVALRLGYCSSQHLAACSQQYLGHSPREMRQKAAG